MGTTAGTIKAVIQTSGAHPMVYPWNVLHEVAYQAAVDVAIVGGDAMGNSLGTIKAYAHRRYSDLPPNPVLTEMIVKALTYKQTAPAVRVPRPGSAVIPRRDYGPKQ